ASPVLKSTTLMGSGTSPNSNPTAIAIEGNYAYITEFGNGTGTPWGQLEIVNVTNPAAPVSVGYVSTGGTNGCFNPQAVAVSGQNAYVACASNGTNNGEFDVFNISNPYSVTQANSASVVLDTSSTPQAMVIQGNYAYISEYGSTTHSQVA